MALTLSGRLYDPFGNALENAGVRFRAARTSTQILANYSAETETDSSGDYTITVRYGVYHIEARQSARDPWYTIARNIPVTTETTSTDINALIVAYVGAGDATPEIVLEIEAIAAAASQSAADAEAAQQAAEAAQQAAESAAQGLLRDKTILLASEFGAVDGENVTDALTAMSDAANALGSGFKIVLDFRQGTVFEQYVNPSPGDGNPYYITKGSPINLSGCSGFSIDCTGCKLTTESGLRYGSFDPLDGNPVTGRQTDAEYGVQMGAVVDLLNCENYVITNPDFDGNNENLVYGSGWGDKGIQLHHFGIRERNVKQGVTINPKCNYFALDGMYLGGIESEGVTHINPVCDYNGRQGLSWTGGKMLTLINPVYRYTGTAGIFSAPGAGIDIEDNGTGCIGMEMHNPRIYGNIASDFLTLNNTDALNVYGGIIASGETCLWADSPGLKFHGTRFYGRIIKATSGVEFIGTLHEDVEFEGVTLEDPGYLIEGVEGDGATWRDAEIICNTTNRLFVQGPARFIGTKIRMRADNPAASSRAAVFEPELMQDTDIIQEYTNLDPSVEAAGGRTYINGLDGISEFKGVCRIIGSALSYVSTNGDVNLELNPNRQVSPFTERFTVSTSGTSATVDIGTGVGVVSVASGRNIALVMQASTQSTASHRHGSILLSSAFDVADGFTFTVIRNGNVDAVQIDDLNDTLDGKVWTVTKLSSNSVPYLPL